MEIFIAIFVLLELRLPNVLPHESAFFFQKPEDVVADNGQAASFNCVVGNFNPDLFKIEWSSLDRDQESLSRKVNSSWDQSSSTLNSTIVFQNPGPTDVGLYFCELYSVERGDVLINFTSAVLTLSSLDRRLECLKSGRWGQENVIHLFKGKENVEISCRVSRRPIIALRWEALHYGEEIASRNYDYNGYRHINATLAWDLRLDGSIVYCKGRTYYNSFVANPCIIGLIKVVRELQIIHSNTSLVFGFVNDVELLCEVAGMSRYSCSFSWTCEPPDAVSGCHGGADAVTVGVNGTTSIPENGGRVEVSCSIRCLEDFHVEATALLNLEPPWNTHAPTKQNRPTALASGSNGYVRVSLTGNLESQTTIRLRCSVEPANTAARCTWYINGERIDNNSRILLLYFVETDVAVCDVCIDGSFTRVWGTFAGLLADLFLQSNSPPSQFNNTTEYDPPDSTSKPHLSLSTERRPELSNQDSSVGTESTPTMSSVPTVSALKFWFVVGLCGLLACCTVFVCMLCVAYMCKSHKQKEQARSVSNDNSDGSSSDSVGYTSRITLTKEEIPGNPPACLSTENYDYAYRDFNAPGSKPQTHNYNKIVEISWNICHEGGEVPETDHHYEILPCGVLKESRENKCQSPNSGSRKYGEIEANPGYKESDNSSLGIPGDVSL